MDSTVQVEDHEATSEAMLETIVNNIGLMHLLNIGFETNEELKSPVTLLYEIARKRKLEVSFEFFEEKVHPHLNVHITQCRVGNLITVEEGLSKAASKKTAAEKIVNELRSLESPTNTTSLVSIKRKITAYKKRVINVHKIFSPSFYIEESNPVTRLNLIQHAKQQKPPKYTVTAKRGTVRRPQFVIEVTLEGRTSVGVGRNKKNAKRNAAKTLLARMGYVSAPAPWALHEAEYTFGGSTLLNIPSTSNSTEEENSLGAGIRIKEDGI